MTNGSTQPVPADDEHKKATKEVVDDMFRDDVLGPRMCSVLENHTPASTKEPAIKNAIESVVDDLDTKRKSRWMDKVTGALWTLGIGAIATLIGYIITHR